MNPYLKHLNAYPFEKLHQLLDGIKPQQSEIDLSIGEPKLPIPEVVRATLIEAVTRQNYAPYLKTDGSFKLREAIATYLMQNTHIPSEKININTQILPLNGTREGLFCVAQALGKANSTVIIPDPCYQIYEGASVMVGAKVLNLLGTAQNGLMFDPADIPVEQLQSCSLMYICSPANPSGTHVRQKTFEKLFELSQKYGFYLLVDECYFDLYFENKPKSALEYANEAGISDFKNILVFHSLSKRSNMAGLRSGFVCGDKTLIERFRHYRTYHGVTMPEIIQSASIKAWVDQTHVEKNRKYYQENLQIAKKYLSNWVDIWPDAGLFILLNASKDDCSLAKALYASCGIKTLPLQFLTKNLMKNHYLRIALVHTPKVTEIACRRIQNYLQLT